MEPEELGMVTVMGRCSARLAGPPEFGPAAMRASSTLENEGQRSYRMSRRRYTPEQIVRKLREADRLLGEGTELPEVWKHLEVSEATYHRWRTRFGGMKADDVKRLKELEAENAKLKRIVADQLLENQALREVNRGNW
jgi:DNA-binding transcriptional MerR regulator